MNGKDKPTMQYKGDRKVPKDLECIFTFKGKDYTIKYETVQQLARLYRLPYQVREQIINWAKMLNNPD
jgi:hypothetical protein